MMVVCALKEALIVDSNLVNMALTSALEMQSEQTEIDWEPELDNTPPMFRNAFVYILGR